MSIGPSAGVRNEEKTVTLPLIRLLTLGIGSWQVLSYFYECFAGKSQLKKIMLKVYKYFKKTTNFGARGKKMNINLLEFKQERNIFEKS